MTLAELVEDAFLSALEQGAKPPRVLEVRLPSKAFRDVADDGRQIRIAGHVLILRSADLIDGPQPLPWVEH